MRHRAAPWDSKLAVLTKNGPQPYLITTGGRRVQGDERWAAVVRRERCVVERHLADAGMTQDPDSDEVLRHDESIPHLNELGALRAQPVNEPAGVIFVVVRRRAMPAKLGN